VNKRKLGSIVCACVWDLVRRCGRKIVERIVGLAVQFRSAKRPGRTFERKFSSCKHPIGYRKNWAGGIALRK
jgi:hypothetical protein